MTFCSVEGIVAISSAAIIHQILHTQSARRGWLSILNFAYLISVVPSMRGLVGLIVFVTATYALIAMASSRSSATYIAVSACVTSLVFAILKCYELYVLLTILAIGQLAIGLSLSSRHPEVARTILWMIVLEIPLWAFCNLLGIALVLSTTFPTPFELIGLSYIFFRFIHVLVDTWDGQIHHCSFTEYVNYQLGFATLVAGPIQRFEDFEHNWRSSHTTAAPSEDKLSTWNRLLTGIIKMSVLAPPLLDSFNKSSEAFRGAMAENVLTNFATAFYCYPVYLYLNFSGYTDLSLGVGSLFGLRLPENFNCPWLARNVTDFWDRWHISLTRWIRDYVFMTSYKASVELRPELARVSGYLLVFVSLFVAGIWHGVDSRYAVFGALHGLGAMAGLIYGDALRLVLGRAGLRDYQQNSTIRLVARVVTFHFVCFTFLYFSSGVGRANKMLLHAWNGSHEFVWMQFNTLGASRHQFVWTSAWVLDVILVMVALVIYCHISGHDRRTGESSPRRFVSFDTGFVGSAKLVAKTVALVLFFIVTWALVEQPAPPDVVYMKF